MIIQPLTMKWKEHTENVTKRLRYLLFVFEKHPNVWYEHKILFVYMLWTIANSIAIDCYGIIVLGLAYNASNPLLLSTTKFFN